MAIPVCVSKKWTARVSTATSAISPGRTLESGLPIIGLNGSSLIGGYIEGSNTDIAEEFSKMIVTQQAYSANTRVVSTSQQMMSEVINMVR